MDYTKNSITILAILCIFSATFIVFSSWRPFTSKSFLFLQKNPHSNSPSVQKDELQIALEKASMPNKTVIIAIINKAYVDPHENEYPTMFDLFLEGFWSGEETRPLLDNLLMVSMDKTAHERCMFRRLNCYRLVGGEGGDGGYDFAGEKLYMSSEFIEMMWRRTLFLLDVLKRGYNFIFTDTDVLWLRNPFTILRSNESLDLQISTDYFSGNSTSTKDNPINTGFYSVKSNNKTISLFETWYEKRKNSSGMKEQDVLQNLVRENILGQLSIKVKFLDTLYFSGFCRLSEDVRLVATVHANCCRTIGAKVVDLKRVLGDWKGYKSGLANGTNYTSNFQWSSHESCINSWK